MVPFLLLLITHFFSGSLSLSCINVHSNISDFTDKAKTHIKCLNPDYPTLVSCGQLAANSSETQRYGTVITTGDQKECRVANEEDSHGVYGVARCCSFDSPVDCEARPDDSWTNGTNDSHTTTCADLHNQSAPYQLDSRFTELMGCHGWSWSHSLEGHYFNSDFQVDSTAAFDGGCTVKNGPASVNYGSRNSLNCCEAPEATFDCVATYGVFGNTSKVSCTGDYTMIGCNAISKDNDIKFSG